MAFSMKSIHRDPASTTEKTVVIKSKNQTIVFLEINGNLIPHMKNQQIKVKTDAERKQDSKNTHNVSDENNMHQDVLLPQNHHKRSKRKTNNVPRKKYQKFHSFLRRNHNRIQKLRNNY